MSDIAEQTDEQQRELGMRTFLLGGQRGTRCTIMAVWEEKDMDGAWQPMKEGRSNRLLVEELLLLLAELMLNRFGVTLR